MANSKTISLKIDKKDYEALEKRAKEYFLTLESYFMFLAGKDIQESNKKEAK